MATKPTRKQIEEGMLDAEAVLDALVDDRQTGDADDRRLVAGIREALEAVRRERLRQEREAAVSRFKLPELPDVIDDYLYGAGWPHEPVRDALRDLNFARARLARFLEMIVPSRAYTAEEIGRVERAVGDLVRAIELAYREIMPVSREWDTRQAHDDREDRIVQNAERREEDRRLAYEERERRRERRDT